MKTKKYSHDWERIDTAEYSPKELALEVLEDEELPNLEKIIIGQYTPGYDMPIDDLLNTFIENKDKLQHIQSFFFGDMDSMECEISWIEQGNYENFLQAFPNIKELIIKGSNELELGTINHPNLERFELISGGIPASVLDDIARANLPSLKSLILYLGVDDYGFDGNLETIKNLVEKMNFPNLKELQLLNSDIQDEIAEMILNEVILNQLDVLGLGAGTLTDKGGQLLFDNFDKLKHLKKLDLEYNFLSDEMAKKLESLDLDINTEDRNEVDVYEYNGEKEYYMWTMYAE